METQTTPTTDSRALQARWPIELLICPACRCSLQRQSNGLACTACRARYPIEDRVVRFVARDEFYEGAYQNVTKYVPTGGFLSLIPLYLINTHYPWWVRRFVQKGAQMLELGCGSGVRFFGRHARTTGVELSFSSIRQIHGSYDMALQADALNLPIADGTYDAVAASYLYEHIGGADRQRLLAEIRRVLCPRGRVVMLFDVTCHNPLFRWFRRDADKYQECFIEHDHHYGLETASANLRRFRENGFRVLDYHLANKTPLQHLAVYQWCRPYRRPLTNMLAGISDRIRANPAAARAYGIGVTLFDDLVEPFLPMDWSRIMLVALEKA